MERIQGENSLRGLGFSWEEELRIVMKAAERHPRNYYAWQYARQIYRCVHPDSPGDKDKVHCDRMLSSGHIGAVHGWCLMHPRDISGWAFLIYFWEQMRKEDAGLLAERELEQAVFKTRTFVEKYQWKGQSIEWFLKAADVLAPQ